MRSLEGRQVIVTGAGSGIGRETAIILAEHGASVLAGDIDIQSASRTAQVQRIEAHHLDVTDPDSWDAIIAAAGKIHALVNCAGIEVPNDTVDGCTTDDWDRVMRVNLDGTFLGTKAAVSAMRADGIKGSIVNFSSILGIVADGATLSYSSSKAAVSGLTKSVALAVAAYGIRCNSIHPGFIRTPMTERWLAGLQDSDAEAGLAARHPLGRLGEPRELGMLVLYLLGDDGAYVSGSELVIDGGYLAE